MFSHKGCHCHHWFKGLMLLVLGVLFLLGTLEVIEFPFLTWWPLIPILMGVKMLLHPLLCKDACKK
ncbi:LiaI-LiaF-like domain-containing protein [Patescibacteria group bacterium]